MRSLLAALMFGVFSITAYAHDKPIKGPNSGQLIHVEDAHYELLSKDNTLTLFVFDNDVKPRATVDGAKATATVLADGKTATIDLTPDTANTLTGTGTGVFVAKTGLRVVVSIQEAGRKPTQIRFTPAD